MAALAISSILLSWLAVAVVFWAIHKHRSLKAARHFIDHFAMATEEILSDPRYPEPVKEGFSFVARHITDARLAKHLANHATTIDNAEATPFAQAIAELPDDLQVKAYRAAWFFLMALSYIHSDGWKLRRRLTTNPSERETAKPLAWAASHSAGNGFAAA
jgi:hypothetical protein